jgi:hypothetical protein
MQGLYLHLEIKMPPIVPPRRQGTQYPLRTGALLVGKSEFVVKLQFFTTNGMVSSCHGRENVSKHFEEGWG